MQSPQLCSFEAYFVRAQLPVHWIDRLRRRVDQLTVFEAEEARLARAGPKFVPASIECVDDSVGFDDICANVSEHRVKQPRLLLFGWRIGSRQRPTTAQHKNHEPAIWRVIDVADGIWAKGVGFFARFDHLALPSEHSPRAKNAFAQCFSGFGFGGHALLPLAGPCAA